MKKKTVMKRILCCILCTLLLASMLAGCGNDDNAAGSANANNNSNADNSGGNQTPPENNGSGDVKAEWPTGDLTIYVPGDAGSPIDVAARIVTDYLETATGKTVKVENDGTGNGEFLMQKLHDADPDGQTLMICGVGSILQYYTGFHEYNSASSEDYTIVCSSLSPYNGSILFAQADAPYNNLDEFVEYVKANPGQVKCAMMSGTTGEVELTMLYRKLGIIDDIKIVEASVEEVATGLLGGTIDVALWYENFVFEEGLKPLVCNRLTREYDKSVNDELAAILDTVPIYGELGYDECYFEFPMFICAPAGLPDEVCELIAETMHGINDDAEASERIGALFADEYRPYSPQETREIIGKAHEAIRSLYE